MLAMIDYEDPEGPDISSVQDLQKRLESAFDKQMLPAMANINEDEKKMNKELGSFAQKNAFNADKVIASLNRAINDIVTKVFPKISKLITKVIEKFTPTFIPETKAQQGKSESQSEKVEKSPLEEKIDQLKEEMAQNQQILDHKKTPPHTRQQVTERQDQIQKIIDMLEKAVEQQKEPAQPEKLTNQSWAIQAVEDAQAAKSEAQEKEKINKETQDHNSAFGSNN